MQIEVINLLSIQSRMTQGLAHAQLRPRAVRLAVLIDRGHRELPIQADHVGKDLPTAAGEHVRVSIAELDGTDAVTLVRSSDQSEES